MAENLPKTKKLPPVPLLSALLKGPYRIGVTECSFRAILGRFSAFFEDAPELTNREMAQPSEHGGNSRAPGGRNQKKTKKTQWNNY